MIRAELKFTRPADLAATAPPELRGLARDAVRLMVTKPGGHTHARFFDLPEFLRPGDLLVVNRSATLPASLPVESRLGAIRLNLSTRYGRGVWLAEPRWSAAQPGPLPLRPGEDFSVDGVTIRAIAPYPGLPRLWFIQAGGGLDLAISRVGRPIRYSYVSEEYPLETYQTIFACVPGSAEMPSAGRPFSSSLLQRLRDKGIEQAEVLLHAGVSSLESSRARRNLKGCFRNPSGCLWRRPKP